MLHFLETKGYNILFYCCLHVGFFVQQKLKLQNKKHLFFNIGVIIKAVVTVCHTKIIELFYREMGGLVYWKTIGFWFSFKLVQNLFSKGKNRFDAKKVEDFAKSYSKKAFYNIIFWIGTLINYLGSDFTIDKFILRLYAFSDKKRKTDK